MSSRHVPEVRDWYCPSCKGKVFASKGVCRCGYKRGSSQSKSGGDWKCPGCNGLVFASKDRCKCGAYKSGLSNRRQASSNQKPGDWNCPGCNELVFASKDKCRKCGTSKPSSNANQPAITSNSTVLSEESVTSNNNTASQVVNSSTNFKPGDWHCNCGTMNFASRAACYKCATPKPANSNDNNANH